MNLNKDQLKAISHKAGPLLIIAGAGTGKTTVVTERIKFLLAKGAAPSEILALTFTEKAAREMEERVDMALPLGYFEMEVATFHKFCDHLLRDEALEIGLDPGYKLLTQVDSVVLMKKHLFDFNLDYYRPLGSPEKFLRALLGHIGRLQDEDISPEEYLEWAKKKKFSDPLDKQKYLELAKLYLDYDALKIKKGYLDFGDLIVKTVKLLVERENVLKKLRNKYKYVLVDEYQDTNYAQTKLVNLLGGSGQITVVADDDQCLPPNTKIATPSGAKLIKSIKKGDEVITAVGKGHTSTSLVNKVFKNKTKTEFITLRTEDGKEITTTANHKMFCFLPAHHEYEGHYFVYLMYQNELGWRIGVTNNPPARLRLERQADKILIIGSYNTEKEARYYESYYAAKYGLPTTPFTPRPGQAIEGKWLKMLFKNINTQKKADKLAKDLNLELDSPQFMLNAVTRGKTKRIKINFLMCHRNYRSKTHKKGFIVNPYVSHAVHLETSEPNVIQKLAKHGFKLTKGKKGMVYKMQTNNINKAWEVAQKLTSLTSGTLDKKFYVGKHKFQHLPARIVPASHIFPGMYVPVLKGKAIVYKKVVGRKETVKERLVYDLEITKSHNFIANGVVVHNSIYRFRGAAISNVLDFKKNFPQAKTVTLRDNYRSKKEILEASYKLIQFNNPDRLEVKEKISKKLKAVRKGKGEVSFMHLARAEDEAERVAEKILFLTNKNYNFKDIAILVRANSHADPFMRALDRAGIPHQFLGPTKLFVEKTVSELIAVLNVLDNVEDSVSLSKVLLMDLWELDGELVSRLGASARRESLPLFDVLVKSENKKIIKIVELLRKLLKIAHKEGGGRALYEFLVESKMLESLIKANSEESEKIAQNVSKFFQKIKTYEVDYPGSSLRELVDWLKMSSEVGESALVGDTDWEDSDAVRLLTVHGAKGLEFPVVFLVNLVSERFPSRNRSELIEVPEDLIKETLPEGDFHIEEERRLFYVGMTRARDKLFLTAANFYGEAKRQKKLSPFIFEALGDKAVSAEKVSSINPTQAFNTKAVVKQKKTKPHIDYLSYSQIEAFRLCPLHYKLRYILGVPTPSSSALSFGTSIHTTLQKLYQAEHPTKKTVEKLLKANWLAEGYSGKKHQDQAYAKALGYLTDYFKNNFYPAKALALEQPFLIPIANNLKVGGKIDRIDDLGKGQIEIVDYKTGQRVPTQNEVAKNLQLTIYALAATKINAIPFGKAPKEIKLSLFYFETGEKISTVRTAADLKKGEAEILKAKKEIESSDFACSGHPLCASCEFQEFCKVIK